MKAYEIMNDIIGEAFLQQNAGNTVDTRKAGNPEKEVKKIALCLTATPDILRQAKAWGADLLITHEPTFYNHWDTLEDTALTKAKQALVNESGLTIYRYHDSMHAGELDLISKGFLETIGWEGEFDGQLGFVFAIPKTPLELAKEIQEKLNLKHPRIVGRRDGAVRKICLALGARGSGIYTEFQTNDYDVILAGELCEWYDCEPIRDLAQMGYQKTILLLGHAGSERDGMAVLARTINGKYDGAEAIYLEGGELYTYLEDDNLL